MKSWTLEIPEVTPSYNAFRKLHWAKQENLEKIWELLLNVAGANNIPKAVDRKRKVTVWRESPYRIDRANAWTPIDKLVIDRLVAMDVLVDDSEKWIEIHIYPVRKKPKRMVIEIEEL